MNNERRCGTCRFYKFHPAFEKDMCFSFHSEKFCEFPDDDCVCSRHQTDIIPKKDIEYVMADCSRYLKSNS